MASHYSGHAPKLIILLFLFLFSITQVSCTPLGDAISAFPQWFNGSEPVENFALNSPSRRDLQKKDDKPFELRILPLGASITWGQHSQSGNGYRKPLRDQLRFDGWQVDMVGTKIHGDMKDKDVEAHSGDVIDVIATAAQKSLPYRPNLVLINAGTNDCRLNLNITGAGGRMRKMIEDILSADGMSNTTIILSTLIPSNEKNTAANRPSVNDQYRDLVTDMRKEGVSIVLADMDPSPPSGASGWISWPDDYTVNGKPDDTHPSDYGYSKMARIWYNAIQDALDQKLIQAPGVVTSTTCEKEYGDGVYAGGLTQRGSGEDDGIYYHDSESKGIIFEQTSKDNDLKFFFARLFRYDRDDLLLWRKYGSSVLYTTWRNTGQDSNRYQKLTKSISVANNCIAPGVNFIDINADGLDDLVCIAKDGTTYASVNNGDGNDETPPSFTDIGKWKDAEPGYDQSRVRLADVDGDGRADYCVISDNGDITCWRNGWINDVPAYWQPLGKRFTGKGMGDVAGVRFADINGDGRDDWLWLDTEGQTTTYTNSRSCIKGKEGDGLNIHWRQGFHKGKSSGPTHYGTGSITDLETRNDIFFAAVYGDVQDFGLLSRRDYVFMQTGIEGWGDNKTFTYKFHVWKNKGFGGTKIKADGDRYCNMMGHNDGLMDYVWILSKGDMRIYPNKGLSSVSDDGESFWGPNYKMFDPTTTGTGKYLDRRDLHLVDWDGDGACDIIWTDPDNNNHVSLWRNKVKETGKFDWEYHANPVPTLYCPEKRGLGLFDIPVHLADVTGNGKADFLCVEKDGRAWGWVQSNDSSWEHIDQFKFAEGKDRANLHWADVDGDGKADLIHTDKFTGDGSVWYNKGRKDISGSRFEWEGVGPKFRGAVAGSCTYFPDLDGNRRADMHSIINSINNTAETWFSHCGRADATGDDGPVEDPHLPVIPATNPVLHFPDNSCDAGRQALIREEFTYAIDMARVASADVQHGIYYETFFSGPNRRGNFAQHTADTFRRSSSMLSGTGEYLIQITCDQTNKGCTKENPWYVHMGDRIKRLNFCNAFFDDSGLHDTSDLLNDCQMDLREAQRARSSIIIHETTHTRYAMRGGPKTVDVAYGFNDCYRLPRGLFDRSCAKYKGEKPICPDQNGDESVCPGNLAALNADTYSFVAAGIYFSKMCNRGIPLPPLPLNTKRDVNTKHDGCQSYDDYIQVDGGESNIDGYVHFGDSYAAGMGTGTTSWTCRVGSNNFGTLLNQWFADKSIPFELKACSGDTLSGLQRQIEEWKNPEQANVGTLSIGGNDVNFSDMVYYCILTPNLFYRPSSNRQYCVDAENKARDYMADTSSNGLQYKLKDAYMSILKKSNRKDFHLYVTSYVDFFNQDTEDCKKSTFHYWFANYNPWFSWDPREVFLTTDLRKEVNELVRTLNVVLQKAVNDANSEWGGEQVHLVDMQPSYSGHQWCEDGVHEPDPTAPGTFFFLSAWNDLPIGSSAVESSEPAEVSALINDGSIPVPNATTCQGDLGSDPDPYAVAMCRVAQEIHDDPNGLQAQRLQSANTAISNGDHNNVNITAYAPTRQTKTFHPRSPGMQLYRNAVISAMQATELKEVDHMSD